MLVGWRWLDGESKPESYTDDIRLGEPMASGKRRGAEFQPTGAPVAVSPSPGLGSIRAGAHEKMEAKRPWVAQAASFLKPRGWAGGLFWSMNTTLCVRKSAFVDTNQSIARIFWLTTGSHDFAGARPDASSTVEVPRFARLLRQPQFALPPSAPSRPCLVFLILTFTLILTQS
jgi:hypothetical protein